MKLLNLTDKDMTRLNADLENKIYKTYGVQEVDLVQFNPNWIKLHFVKNNATYIVYRSDLAGYECELPCLMPKDIGKTGDKAFTVVNQPNSDIKTVLENRFDEIYDLINSVQADYTLYGTLMNVNYLLFMPFDTSGETPTEKFQKYQIKDRPYCFIYDDAESVYRSLEIPLAWRGKCLNIGNKISGSNSVMPYRFEDLDEENVPLYNIDVMLGYNDKLQLNESSANLTPCAQRRLKLFDAAMHLGSRIIDDGNWIAAVCFEYPQCHVFGRLKPKVIPGTNEIDPECNLEDWEGITPEKKQIRDDPSAEWIKDGIDDGYGHSFDKLSGESGQPVKSFGCETAWCNCGVLNGDGTWAPKMKTNMYFEYYNNNGKTPYIVLMDKSRGALYQYVKMYRHGMSIVNFLNEDDKIDSGHRGNPPDDVQIKFFNMFCEKHSDFKMLIDSIDQQYFD